MRKPDTATRTKTSLGGTRTGRIATLLPARFLCSSRLSSACSILAAPDVQRTHDLQNARCICRFALSFVEEIVILVPIIVAC